jgi:hypothetical protein
MYRAVRIRQTESGKWLVLFAAPATEIDEWAGIPQKKKIGGEQETTGFQREENGKRIEELIKFYSDKNNIIQNPLLCATRQTEEHVVVFEPDANILHTDSVETGTLTIQPENLHDLTLLNLLKRVKVDLEVRVPSLVGQQPSEKTLISLKMRASSDSSFQGGELDFSDDQEDEDNEAVYEKPDSQESTGEVFSDESHIFDFWEEVAARVALLEELGYDYSGEVFLDYTKDAMISFLRPIVVVDGQHRLRGAIESAKALSGRPPHSGEIEQLVFAGVNPSDAQKQVESKISRNLPVSLLITDDPAEHVFQFVVVNQTATPIGKALLGTIVSTSLSKIELERVSDRLEQSGIKLEASRAVAHFTRNPKSPFFHLVERGLASEKDLLQWNVFRSLIRIFQDLKGGRIYGENIDWSDKWNRSFLADSGIVEDWEARGFSSAYSYWSDIEGPWREVFSAFWITVRDKLADVDDNSTYNYWGNPNVSNIFNKVSLTILSADFFQYLCEKGHMIDDAESVSGLVDTWLGKVNVNYFSRHWNLSSGLRKDTPAVRDRWAKLWSDYRKDPIVLPKISKYNLK